MLPIHLKTKNIRRIFQELLDNKKFTSINREASMTSLVGNSTIEIVGASFIADEDAIFGTVNLDYVEREEAWYYSKSLNVNNIPGGPPAVWKAVADTHGFINSNYGYLIFSEENGSQYKNTLIELQKNPESRRAVMIYTRPEMWVDYNKNGRSDFICTTDVQYLIRDGYLNAVVRMRSNDSIMGFKNDRAWQVHILTKLARELGVPVGEIVWQVGSLHVYARHYYLVDHYSKTGEISISKEDYVKMYPTSQYI